MIVYRATNKINGKSYIGLTTKTLEFRRWQHENYAKRGLGYAFHRAIRKYGSDSFLWDILATANTEDELKEIEVSEISKVPSEKLYNMTLGGDGTFGRYASEETKRKISKNHADFSGEKHPKYGTKLSTETRDKIRKSLTGRQCPEKRCKIVRKFISKDGRSFIGILFDFCKIHNLNPSSVRGFVTGNRKSHKGWSLDLDYSPEV